MEWKVLCELRWKAGYACGDTCGCRQAQTRLQPLLKLNNDFLYEAILCSIISWYHSKISFI
jgi:hypothetical protein